MKFKTRLVLFIVALCSCVSLFCVGFANWVITQSPVSVTGKITADDVKILESCVAFDTSKGDKGIDIYTLALNTQGGIEGFLVGDNVSTEASVTIYLVVDIKELVRRNSLMTLQAEDKYINFETTVKFGGNNIKEAQKLFTCFTTCDITCYYDDDLYAETNESNVLSESDNLKCSYTVQSIDVGQDKLHLDVKFNFDVITLEADSLAAFYNVIASAYMTFETRIMEGVR